MTLALNNSIAAITPELIEWRRDLHRKPAHKLVGKDKMVPWLLLDLHHVLAVVGVVHYSCRRHSTGSSRAACRDKVEGSGIAVTYR